MSDIQIIKLVFGILLSFGGLVLFILAYKTSYKYLVQEKRCTKSTLGKVIRTTTASRGNGIFLPVVSYQVEGKEYKVIGPDFRSIQVIGKNGFWKDNDLFYEIDEKKQILKINCTENSLITIRKNPMSEIYPIGSSVTVYYDPNQPKLAFVERYCNKKSSFWLLFLGGMTCFIILLLMMLVL